MTDKEKEKAEEMRNTLVTLIMNELSFEFEEKHLAKNLVDTIKVTYINGNVYIDIPAQAYNMSKYIKTGIIEYKNGSYANKLDESGSRWGNHRGYVERCINNAIAKWKSYYSIQTNISEEKVDR